MGVLTLKSGEQRLLQTVAALATCNPYTEERSKLEKRALGKAYEDLKEGIPAFIQNGDRISEKAERLGERIREAYRRGETLPESQLDPYRKLVYFLVYHGMSEEMDQFIGSFREGKRNPSARSLYRDLEGRLEHWLWIEGTWIVRPAKTGHLLALFFQIRRAFFNTHHFIIGQSEPARRLRAQIWNSVFTHDLDLYRDLLFDRLNDVTTLITGPSGSGKELVARAVAYSRYLSFQEEMHTFAEPLAQLLYPINLSALSETLIESELFGHRKGAFTGALVDRMGYFETCGSSGSIFLDEIGETSTAIQVKLLRVLQSREFQRIGETDTRNFQGKLIAATNRNLEEEIHRGRFREDFYFRLCSDRIQTPRLAALLEGNPRELVRLVEFIAQRMVGPAEAEPLTEKVCQWIQDHLGATYSWPGNFRELEQCFRNILVQGHYYPPGVPPAGEDPEQSRIEAGEATNRELLSWYYTKVFQKTGNLAKASDLLGVDRRTVKKYLQDPE